MRRFSPSKLALSAFAAALFAFAVIGRPLTAPLPNTIRIADMTWVEVRTALGRGYTRVIVPSGGIEQNGAHMVLGKHDYGRSASPVRDGNLREAAAWKSPLDAV